MLNRQENIFTQLLVIKMLNIKKLAYSFSANIS